MGFSLLYYHIADGLEASYATTGWVGSLCQGITQMSGFLYAALVLRAGCRVTSITGGLLAATGYLLSAFAPNVYTLYLTYGAIAGACDVIDEY